MKQKLFIVLFVLSLTVSIAFAQRNNEFLSREFIDNTVQGAFNEFVIASRDAGGTNQERVVRNARETVANLRRLAENDPNRRYVLWRLSELEAQISLEEEEINFRRRYANVQLINELVDLFNAELLQAMPNFANLQQLYNRMFAIDARTTNQFADRINQKMRSVTHNLTQDINSAFQRNNYAQAETYFLYVAENRRFLRISEANLETWRRRIQARKDADYLQANLGNRINFVNGIVRENRLLEAKRHIEVLSADLTGATALLPRNFVTSTRTQLNELSTGIDRREDSLVQHGHALINAGRFDEAGAFLSNVLMPAGINRDRIAGIDRAIISATGSTMRQAEYQSGIRSFDVSAASIGSGEALNERMRQRTDSIRAAARAEEERVREHFERRNRSAIRKHNSETQSRQAQQARGDAFLQEVQLLFDNGRYEAAVRKFKGRQAQQAFMHGTPSLFLSVKTRVNSQTGANNENDSEVIVSRRRIEETGRNAQQQRAQRIMGEILDLLEGNRTAQAYSVYFFNRTLLEEHSYREALVSMRRSLVQSYARNVM